MEHNSLIYFDNAASSFPKPPPVIEAIIHYLNNIAIAPGHSHHLLSEKAQETVEDANLTIANFFGVKESYKNFLFTVNATYAINQTLMGFLKPGDHVIYSSLEHNAVLRPIKLLESKEIITTSLWQCSENGELDLKDLESLIKSNTKLLLVTHASNIINNINDVKNIAQWAHRNNIKIGVDATQAAGVVGIDLNDLNVDFLFFTGHKFLLGPVGIGGAYIKNPEEVEAVIVGGGGHNSTATLHPEYVPDKYAPGTQNAVGIIGLAAGIQFVNTFTPLQKKTFPLIQKLLTHMRHIEEIDLYPANSARGNSFTEKHFSPIISFKIKGLIPTVITDTLSTKFHIATRAGLHCAPLAHKSIGSYPNGTVRISLGYHNTEEEVDYFINSLKEIIHKKI